MLTITPLGDKADVKFKTTRLRAAPSWPSDTFAGVNEGDGKFRFLETLTCIHGSRDKCLKLVYLAHRLACHAAISPAIQTPPKRK
ncbi:unnamed protein product [Protopolystoma xenopodis]|uniref:Uncharacterized protein n=1 Tax=Protopolystoma xenopodis TaxID=117903 RepID=A0A448WAU3_9PLAT|nr:unnamed protein product [Protopolystoma xenopodis]